MQRLPRKEMIIEMLQNEPGDAFLNYALALEQIAAMEFETAKSQLEKTLAFDKGYLPCYYQLGQVCEKLQDKNTALSYYRKGLELAKAQQNTKAVGELNEAILILGDD